MSASRVELLDMPAHLQLDPGDVILDANQWPRRAFFMPLFGTLGANLAIGRTMAMQLVGFSWPKFLEPKDPKWRWLYVARAPTAGVVKIGLSGNPLLRMQSLRTTIPKMPMHEFELLGALPFCSRAHESTLCNLFGGVRFSGKEWLRETAATRILCWHVVEMRSTARVKREADRNFGGLVQGLRYVSVGKIPWPFHSRPCGACGSRRHARRVCLKRALRADERAPELSQESQREAS
jgi:hypothetical protein